MILFGKPKAVSVEKQSTCSEPIPEKLMLAESALIRSKYKNAINEAEAILRRQKNEIERRNRIASDILWRAERGDFEAEVPIGKYHYGAGVEEEDIPWLEAHGYKIKKLDVHSPDLDWDNPNLVPGVKISWNEN